MIHTKVFNSSAVFRVSVRTFSTSNSNHRNKSVIYNCDDRPEPILEEKFREKVEYWIRDKTIQYDNVLFRLQLLNGYKHPRSLPIVAPSQDFTKSVQNMLDKGNTTFGNIMKFKKIFF